MQFPVQEYSHEFILVTPMMKALCYHRKHLSHTDAPRRKIKATNAINSNFQQGCSSFRKI